jgi:hypothetical protein
VLEQHLHVEIQLEPVAPDRRPCDPPFRRPRKRGDGAGTRPLEATGEASWL